MSGTDSKPILADASGMVRTATDAEERALENHDGRLPEPTRQEAARLWRWLIATLCLILVAMAGTFVYLAVVGQIDSAALVGLFMGVLASCMDLYRRRQS